MRSRPSATIAGAVLVTLSACSEQLPTQPSPVSESSADLAAMVGGLTSPGLAVSHLHPVGGSGVRAEIRFADPGFFLVMTGTAQGLDPNETYISLIYDIGSRPGGSDACEPTVFDSEDPEFLAHMFLGTWNVAEDGTGTLNAQNVEGQYVPLGTFRTVSIRRVTGPNPGDDVLEACGVVTPRRR